MCFKDIKVGGQQVDKPLQQGGSCPPVEPFICYITQYGFLTFVQGSTWTKVRVNANTVSWGHKIDMGSNCLSASVTW